MTYISLVVRLTDTPTIHSESNFSRDRVDNQGGERRMPIEPVVPGEARGHNRMPIRGPLPRRIGMPPSPSRHLVMSCIDRYMDHTILTPRPVFLPYTIRSSHLHPQQRPTSS